MESRDPDVQFTHTASNNSTLHYDQNSALWLDRDDCVPILQVAQAMTLTALICICILRAILDFVIIFAGAILNYKWLLIDSTSAKNVT